MPFNEKYGWYSKKQHTILTHSVKYKLETAIFDSGKTKWEKRKHNCYIYKIESGDNVICTEVTSTTEYPTSNFDDFVFLGKVVKFVKACYTKVQ